MQSASRLRPVDPRVPVWGRVAAVPLVAAIVLAGLWFFAGVVTDDFRASMGLTALWFAVAGLAALLVGWKRRALRLPVIGTYVVVVALVGGYLGWTTLRDRTVNEQVVRGPALVEGQFDSIAHSTEGRAAVVELPTGERKVTLTSFETDPGPDLRVYVVPGRTSGDSVDGGTDLGALKGNVGNQQYTLPASFDLEGGGTVVIWCRAFSVPFGAAPLAS